MIIHPVLAHKGLVLMLDVSAMQTTSQGQNMWDEVSAIEVKW